MRVSTFPSGYDSGQPFSRVTDPSIATRRAGRPAASSQAFAPAPNTIAAVAAVLAATHVAATTDAVLHGESTGPPVRGSIT